MANKKVQFIAREAGGKVGPSGKKPKGLGVAEAIIAKYRTKHEKQKVKNTGITAIELLAMKKLGVESKEELVKPGSMGEKLAKDLANKPISFKSLLFKPGLCKEIGRDVASGLGLPDIAKKYKVELAAVRKYVEDYVQPVLQQQVQQAIKDNFVKEDIGIEQVPQIVLAEDRVAAEWSNDVEDRGITKPDYKVYKSGFMTRAALAAKQAASEGIDEAAVEHLKLKVQHSATETVGEILKVLAGRKQRRDKWMSAAFIQEKFNVLPGLSQDELADLKMMAELTGLQTAVKAEEKVAAEDGAKQTTNVMMVRMDGITPANRATIDVTQSSRQAMQQQQQHKQQQQPQQADQYQDRLPLHKLFPLDVEIDRNMDKVSSDKRGGMMVERVRKED